MNKIYLYAFLLFLNMCKANKNQLTTKVLDLQCQTQDLTKILNYKIEIKKTECVITNTKSKTTYKIKKDLCEEQKYLQQIYKLNPDTQKLFCKEFSK